MTHDDHVRLIRDGITRANGSADSPVWADLGAGTGAFTLALADLLGGNGRIIAVDRDARALRELEAHMRDSFPQTDSTYLTSDFTRPLDLPPLDGIVMANALHFVLPRQKPNVIQRVKGCLRPGGRLVMIEYNVDNGNMWVPHPFSYTTWESMARAAGFTHTRLLATVPSRFLGQIYAALSE